MHGLFKEQSKHWKVCIYLVPLQRNKAKLSSIDKNGKKSYIHTEIRTCGDDRDLRYGDSCSFVPIVPPPFPQLPHQNINPNPSSKDQLLFHKCNPFSFVSIFETVDI